MLADAVAIARTAGDFTMQHWNSKLDIESKSDGSEVTIADRGAEQIVRNLLAAQFPNDAILGEEYGTTHGTSGLTWVVDPIDGTYGFVRGVPLFSTLLALVGPAGVEVGVIYLPALDMMVAAGRGVGCFANGVTTKVSTTTQLDGALLCTSDWSASSIEQLTAVHGAGLKMRTWGDAYGYAMVALGRADAMVDPICSAWDLAPMPIILSEAGGRFTDLTGVERHDGGHGLASNGILHEQLLGLVGVQ